MKACQICLRPVVAHDPFCPHDQSLQSRGMRAQRMGFRHALRYGRAQHLDPAYVVGYRRGLAAAGTENIRRNK